MISEDRINALIDRLIQLGLVEIKAEQPVTQVDECGDTLDTPRTLQAVRNPLRAAT